MSDVVIRVENLRKVYSLNSNNRLGQQEGLRHAIERTASAPLRIAKKLFGSKSQVPHETAIADPKEFWAVDDISFDIRRGEVVGIIGKNGAGKSTLLKLLSRVTSPTSGRIGVKGRIASLLEVGTGFHPELTGRENIYLNGAILGMTRQEVKQKFDEIVDFAGVSQFLDTPVKRYSSGMYVRLAFGVAAHLEPEILVIDEVLAVGDAEFQKKCLGKMRNVAHSGRTVLFVSHNMGMVSSLCTRGLLLSHGKLVADKTASEAVIHYFTDGNTSPHFVQFDPEKDAPSDEGITLLEASIRSTTGERVGSVDMRESFSVEIKYRLEKDFTRAPWPNLHIKDSSGNYVCTTAPPGLSFQTAKAGVYEARCVIPGGILNNGTFFISVYIANAEHGQHAAIMEHDLLCIDVTETMEEHIKFERNGYAGSWYGSIRPPFDWEVKSEA